MADTSVVAGMTEQQIEDNAKQAVALKQRQHDAMVRSGGVATFINTAKRSLLFQPNCNWNDMLSGAPVSISLMGSIFIASTTELAQGITLIPPTGGFKHISTIAGSNNGEMALSACLSQVSDLGSIAFVGARTGMSAIAINSADIIEDVKTVARLLQDPDSARISLKTTVDKLSKEAKYCAQKAKEMADNYHVWLAATCEVHAACCQASTDTTEKQRVNEVHLAAKQVESKITQEAADAAKDTMETMRISLQHADEAYQKAAKEFPSGWELIAQEAVSNLVSTATNALNQAIPAVIDAYTVQGRMKEAKQGFSIFKDGYGAIKGEKSADHSDVKPATSATPPMPNVLPDNYQDPAYTVIKTSAGWVDTLNQTLTSNNGGIDWKSAGGAAGSNRGAGFLQIMLDTDLTTLNKKPATTQPSTDLKLILTECKTVAAELDKYSGPSMNDTRPKNDSPEVKKWIETVQKHNVKAAAMNAIAANIPGPGAAPAATPPYQKVEGTGLRAQIISAATTKLNTTSSVLTASQANFTESGKNYAQVMTSLGLIQGELSKLKADKIQLEQIKVLLMKCIELLVQLQAQINKLVAFFDSVQLIVEIAVNNQVDPLLQRINDVTAQPLKLGHYNITLFTAELVFNSMLNVRTYFTLFQELAEVYEEVHKKHLEHGLVLVGQMQTESRGTDAAKQLKIKQDELNKYTNTSLPAIRTLLDTREAEVKDGMKKTAEDIAADVTFLPVPVPEPIKQANTDAKVAAIEAAKPGLQENGSYYQKQIPAGTFPSE